MKNLIILLYRERGVSMATADQIKMLVKSHFAENEEQFNTTVLQLAAQEARKGRTELALEIKKIVEMERVKKNKVVHFNKFNELIDYKKPDYRLAELVLKPELRERIERIIKEFRKQDKLKKYNLKNRRKILLVGPPGTGKTMTASVLATELDMNLGTVMVDKMVTKFMGETSAKLRQIFDDISNVQGVYLFDEFDTIGTERSRDDDVGEMRRILNSFLQFLEQDESTSLIIAATNNIKMLDQALFRRFDDVIFFENPNKVQIIKLISNKTALFLGDVNLEKVAQLAMGLSHAEISSACEDSIKEVILNDEEHLTEKILVEMISDRKAVYKKG